MKKSLHKMLRPIVYALIFTTTLSSCREQVSNLAANFTPIHYVIDDLSWGTIEYMDEHLQIDIVNRIKNATIIIKKEEQSTSYDLSKMSIASKTPELTTLNKEFAHFTTWYSGPFSNHLFIELENPDKYLVRKNLVAYDLARNNIVWVKSENDDQYIVLQAENLITGKKMKLVYQTDKPNSQAQYFDSIQFINDDVVIYEGANRKKYDVHLLNYR